MTYKTSFVGSYLDFLQTSLVERHCHFIAILSVFKLEYRSNNQVALQLSVSQIPKVNVNRRIVMMKVIPGHVLELFVSFVVHPSKQHRRVPTLHVPWRDLREQEEACESYDF